MRAFFERLPRSLLWAFCFGVSCLPAAGQTPKLVSTWPGYLRREMQRADVSGRYAYVASYYAGLEILDLSDIAHPVRVGGYNPNGNLPLQGSTAENVVVSGNYAYVVFRLVPGRSGLHVVDVSDPTAPVVRGKTFTSRHCNDVAVAGHYAYVAAEADGLFIADVTDPSAPVQRGFYNTSGEAMGVAVADNLAY